MGTKWRIAWVFIFEVLCLSNLVGFGQELPRSLSYWELTFQIVRSPELRRALDISPAQKAAVDAMRSDKKFKELFFSKIKQEVEIRQQQLAAELEKGGKLSDLEKKERRNALRSQQDADSIDRNSFVYLNDEVQLALGTILTAEQMAMLAQTVLRAKFATGLRPFEDAEILTFCKVPQSWRNERVESFIRTAKSEYSTGVNELKLESCKRMIAAMPQESQKRFVNYAGNSFAPKVRALDDLASLSFVHIASCDSPAIKALNLPADLTNQLMEMHESFFRSIRGASIVLPAGQTRDRWVQERERELDLSIRKLLSEQQVLSLVRAQAFDDIMRDIHKPFTRPELVEYLQLDEMLSRYIAVLANEEQSKRNSEIRKFDRETFEKLCATLPEPSKDSMTKLFKGVWEIPIEPMLWISAYSR